MAAQTLILTATLTASPAHDEFECTEHACRDAYSPAHLCECACSGAGHGIQWRSEAAHGNTLMAARIVRVGGVFNTVPDVSSWDEAF